MDTADLEAPWMRDPGAGRLRASRHGAHAMRLRSRRFAARPRRGTGVLLLLLIVALAALAYTNQDRFLPSATVAEAPPKAAVPTPNSTPVASIPAKGEKPALSPPSAPSARPTPPPREKELGTPAEILARLVRMGFGDDGTRPRLSQYEETRRMAVVREADALMGSLSYHLEGLRRSIDRGEASMEEFYREQLAGDFREWRAILRRHGYDPDAMPRGNPAPEDKERSHAPAPPSGTVMVRLYVPDGKPIPADAKVGLRRGQEPVIYARLEEPGIGARTAGALKGDRVAYFRDLPLESVEVFVEAAGYKPASHKVTVTGSHVLDTFALPLVPMDKPEERRK